jgi:hypothetical protein
MAKKKGKKRGRGRRSSSTDASVNLFVCANTLQQDRLFTFKFDKGKHGPNFVGVSALAVPLPYVQIR